MQTLRQALPRRIASIRAVSMLATLLAALAALLVTSVSTAPRAYAASRASEQYHLAQIGEITVPGAPTATLVLRPRGHCSGTTVSAGQRQPETDHPRQ